MVISRTPFRVSFFGGGTDYPSWYRQHGGSVLSTAIDKFCYISVRVLPPFFEHKFRIVYSKIESCNEIGDIQHAAVGAILKHCRVETGLEIHHDGDLPARSGTGSSSSFTVGLLNALNVLSGRMLTKRSLANEAILIERDVMKENVGSQDQIAAAFGGLNRINFFSNDEFEVRPIALPKDIMSEMAKNLILLFTGLSRNATDVAGAYNDVSDGRKESILKQTVELVEEGENLLREHNIDEFGRLLDVGWQTKRSFNPSVSNELIDSIYNEAINLGALGGKLIGAGSGGFVLLYAKEVARRRILETFGSKFVCVPFGFDKGGSTIILHDTKYDDEYAEDFSWKI